MPAPSSRISNPPVSIAKILGFMGLLLLFMKIASSSSRVSEPLFLLCHPDCPADRAQTHLDTASAQASPARMVTGDSARDKNVLTHNLPGNRAEFQICVWPRGQDKVNIPAYGLEFNRPGGASQSTK